LSPLAAIASLVIILITVEAIVVALAIGPVPVVIAVIDVRPGAGRRSERKQRNGDSRG
jgi:hypothetical protein